MFGDTKRGFALANQALEEGENRQFSLGALALCHLSEGDASQADAKIQEARQGLENGESDPRAGYAIFQVIEGEVGLANQHYQEVLALTGRTLSSLHDMGQRVFLPDILRCKGEALFAVGQISEADQMLDEALSEAKAQNSPRALWPILAALARLAAHRGDSAEANELRRQAQEVVDYIADCCGTPELRASFLNSFKVREGLGAE